MSTTKEITIECYDVFKVIKSKEEKVEHIRLLPDPAIEQLMKENLIKDLLRKKLSKHTQVYDVEEKNNPIKSLLDKMLRASKKEFSALANEVAAKYKLVERSRSAILVVLSFKGKSHHVCLFKLPPHPSMIVEGESVRYAAEAFEKYQKAIIYPDMLTKKDVKVTQKDTYSEYILKLLNAKPQKTAEDTLYEIWRGNPTITFSDLKSWFAKYPAIKKALVTVEIGEQSFKTQLRNVEKQLGRLGDIHIAILEGHSSFVKIKGSARIEIHTKELDNINNIIKAKGG